RPLVDSAASAHSTVGPARWRADLAADPRAAIGPRAFIAAGLLAVGVAIGIAGLFAGYFGTTSLASQSDQLFPHVIYLATWAISAILLVLRRASQRTGNWQRIGALLAAGTSVITFGFFLADLGTGVTSGSPGGGSAVGAGLVVSLIGWAACAAGSLVALRLGPLGSAGPAARPPWRPPGARNDRWPWHRDRLRPVVGRVHREHSRRRLAVGDRRKCLRQPGFRDRGRRDRHGLGRRAGHYRSAVATSSQRGGVAGRRGRAHGR